MLKTIYEFVSAALIKLKFEDYVEMLSVHPKYVLCIRLIIIEQSLNMLNDVTSYSWSFILLRFLLKLPLGK